MDAVKLDELLPLGEEEKIADKRVLAEIDVSGRKMGAPATLLARLDDYGMIQFSLKSGGTLPQILQGSFTSLAAAESAIQVWQSRLPKESVTIVPPPKVSKDAIELTDIVGEE